jgi:hypothetical protein
LPGFVFSVSVKDLRKDSFLLLYLVVSCCWFVFFLFALRALHGPARSLVPVLRSSSSFGSALPGPDFLLQSRIAVGLDPLPLPVRSHSLSAAKSSFCSPPGGLFCKPYFRGSCGSFGRCVKNNNLLQVETGCVLELLD